MLSIWLDTLVTLKLILPILEACLCIHIYKGWGVYVCVLMCSYKHSFDKWWHIYIIQLNFFFQSISYSLNKLDISLSVSVDLAYSLKPGIGFYNVCVSCSVMSDSLWPHGLSMEFSRQENGVGCHFLLQGICLTQGPNPGLLRCRQILHCLSYKGS